MKKLLIRVIAIVAIAAIVWGGIGVWNRFVNTAVVEYVVSGNAASALVTIRNSNGELEYYPGVTLPYTYKFTKFEGSSLYVSAKNEGELGSVMVSIYYKGKLVKSHADAGPFVVAESTYLIEPEK